MSEPDTVAERRLQLLHAGFEPLPVNGKIPAIKAWQTHDGVSEREIAFWSKHYPLASNTGILTARAPAFDIDILAPEAATAVEELTKERFEELGYVLTRFGKAPKRAILFRCDAPFAKIKVELIAPDGSSGQKLELLASGQQIVVFGTHPETGRAYGWHGGEPGPTQRADLPYINEAEAQVLVADSVALLVSDLGYRRAKERPKGRRKPNGAGDDKAEPTAKAAPCTTRCAISPPRW